MLFSFEYFDTFLKGEAKNFLPGGSREGFKKSVSSTLLRLFFFWNRQVAHLEPGAERNIKMTHQLIAVISFYKKTTTHT